MDTLLKIKTESTLLNNQTIQHGQCCKIKHKLIQLLLENLRLVQYMSFLKLLGTSAK